MKILISGASGLVGSALASALTADEHTILRLVRHAPRDDHEVGWDPATGALDPVDRLAELDACVHLAGENIGGKRWSARQKRELHASRVDATRKLVSELRKHSIEPGVFVAASAVGYYGSRGDELLDEKSARGSGYLAELCESWEHASDLLEAGATRLVHARFGMILSAHGGALAKMLLPFRLGLGGKIGSGRQYMSWISLTDVVRAISYIVRDSSLGGVINVVAPHAVTNAQFTKALGRVLGRPTVLPLPAFAARLAFGEMADELLLASQRVEPRVLASTGFAFEQPELEAALRHELNL